MRWKTGEMHCLSVSGADVNYRTVISQCLYKHIYWSDICEELFMKSHPEQVCWTGLLFKLGLPMWSLAVG